MEISPHTLSNLFEQLGLPSEAPAIDRFVRNHSPLPPAVRLSEASFWTPAQAGFLHEELLKDADWAEVVDGLNQLLHS